MENFKEENKEVSKNHSGETTKPEERSEGDKLVRNHPPRDQQRPPRDQNRNQQRNNPPRDPNVNKEQQKNTGPRDQQFKNPRNNNNRDQQRPLQAEKPAVERVVTEERKEHQAPREVLKDKSQLPRIGISIGDINGVGPEVILKTLSDNRILQTCVPIVYASGRTLAFHKKTLNLGEFSFSVIKEAQQAGNKQPNLINLWEEEDKIEIGQSNDTGGKRAFQSLEAAVNDLKEGKLDALVTAPINKKNIQSDQFKFAGHTEYLAEKAGVSDYLMLLCSENMRVGTVTGHIALNEVAAQISEEKIIRKIKVLNNALITDFGIRKPRIAVLGLNPHNGDDGLMGQEEKNIILPAILKAREEGMMVFGPYAADGFFGSDNFTKFDAILSMYHDQGLVPFKALSFDTGVNYTAGLPFIRTSPDHGVGYDIAGKGTASEQSFREAIYLATDIYFERKLYKEINQNPLAFSKKEAPRRGIE